MGIFDIFGAGGADKAQKLKPKVTQKYGDAAVRQKAIAQVAALEGPESISVLMARFTLSVEPQTTDLDEKENVFELICSRRSDAVEPVKEFLAKSDVASSWALKILGELLPETEVIGIATSLLEKLGSSYTRNPEKKEVLLGFLEGKDDPRIAPIVLPLLEDMLDDVKIAALKVLGPLKYEPARVPILELLVTEETAKRVRTAAIAALHASELGVQGYREKVEAVLLDPYFVDKAGQVKKRG